MTDRVNALIVALEVDMRDDDAQGLVDAITQLRGVSSVRLNVADMDDWLAKDRAKRELRQKIHDLLWQD